MADADIPSDEASIKKTVARNARPIERGAGRRYDIAPAVLPAAFGVTLIRYVRVS
jgi:hypothetical protein